MWGANQRTQIHTFTHSALQCSFLAARARAWCLHSSSFSRLHTTTADVFVIGQQFSPHTEPCLHSALSLAHRPSLNPHPPPSPPPHSNAPSTSYVDAWVGWGRSTKASTQHSDSAAMARRRSSVKNTILTLCVVLGFGEWVR